ncbi:AGE family epimerase/isomerase [Tissierellaceae bacterium HCP3S3_D8]
MIYNNFEELNEFYRKEIEMDFFPFWKRAYDGEFGGVYTCFNNQGTELSSKDKYTWSQGRFLWLVSNLYRMVSEGKLNLDLSEIRDMADKTFQFLKDNVFLDDFKCAYALTREGDKIDFDGRMDISIFADTFVLIGFNAYGRFLGNKEALEYANRVLNSIMDRINSNEYMTEPYPIDKAFKSHSIPMILSNCLQECLEASRDTGFRYDLRLEDLLQEKIDEILDYHVQENNTICELKTEIDEYKDTLLYNHVNPGHTIECLWFLIHGLESLGGYDNRIDKIKEIFNSTLDIGMDKEFGGLLRFVNGNKGLKPEGRLIGDKFEELINDTWDYKLWWPHSELLYTSLLLYFKTKDKDMLEIYDEAHKYVFHTFPNPDKEIGEWIQIRDREGRPINKVVALPVKDPFHILRNFMLILDLLHERGEEYEDI